MTKPDQVDPKNPTRPDDQLAADELDETSGGTTDDLAQNDPGGQGSTTKTTGG